MLRFTMNTPIRSMQLLALTLTHVTTRVVLLFALLASVATQSIQIKSSEVPEGCEKRSQYEDLVKLHYQGVVDESSAAGTPGDVFGDSRAYDVAEGKPAEYQIGSGRVVGWDEGLVDMCEGEKRYIVIPPELGYGEKGLPPKIPPNATLGMTLELLAILEKPPNIWADIDTDLNHVIEFHELMEWVQREHPNAAVDFGMKLLVEDDKDLDGMLTWEEFTGPKGVKRPGDPIWPEKTREDDEEQSRVAKEEYEAAKQGAKKEEKHTEL